MESGSLGAASLCWDGSSDQQDARLSVRRNLLRTIYLILLKYSHHFSDILAGSVLGTGMAFLGYMLNYHALTGQQSHLPKNRKEERVLYFGNRPPHTKRRSEYGTLEPT